MATKIQDDSFIIRGIISISLITKELCVSRTLRLFTLTFLFDWLSMGAREPNLVASGFSIVKGKLFCKAAKAHATINMTILVSFLQKY